MEKMDLIEEIIELQRKVDRARRQYQLDIWMGLPITMLNSKASSSSAIKGAPAWGSWQPHLGLLQPTRQA